jgi:hypothetical protein
MTISGNTVIKSAIVANNTPGTAGYYLRTSGTGVYWSPVAGASLSGYSTWSALTATNTAIRSLVNSTNTALRTLVSDRLQVANAVATYATKASPTTSGVFAHTGRATISTNLSVTGNTGIGSSAAEAQVTISHATAPTLYISETGGVGVPTLFLKQYGTVGEGLKVTYDSATGHSYINNVYSGGSLFLQTVSTTRLSIDSSGRVTMPYQPAFYADTGSTGTWTTYNCASNSTNYVLIFTNGRTNVNGHYNTGNGFFTAPVAGRYFFGGQAYVAGGGYHRIQLIKSDGQTVLGHTYMANDMTITVSGIFYMNAGDSIALYATLYDQNIYMGSVHSFFYGYLIG